MNLKAQNPSMSKWTEAWSKVASKDIKSLYAQNAILFPHNKKAIHGNDKIVNYLIGGMGKMDVVFKRSYYKIDENMAFEYGTFQDLNIKTKEQIAFGSYSVTWICEGNNWKIICHQWHTSKSSLVETLKTVIN